MEIQGKVVAVTGGASGIGAALCRRFAAESPTSLVVIDLDGPGATRVADEVGGIAVQADLATAEGVAAAVDAARDVGGGSVDLWCSNAGVAVAGDVHDEADDAGWQISWDVNVMAAVRATRLLLPGWLERGEGYLLSTVSAAGLLNHVLAAPYAASKAAALSFAEHIAIAYHDQGIRVSALCPQGVRTPMLREDRSGFLDAGALEPEQVADVVVEGLADERFLILPHPEVADYVGLRGADHARWLGGMRKMRRNIVAAMAETDRP